MTRLKWLFLFLGAALLAVLIARERESLLAAFRALGWGLALIVTYRAVPIAMNGWGWHTLLGRSGGGLLGPAVAYSWIAESINNLLPVARIGGDVVRARLLGRLTGQGAWAGATVLADFTLGLTAQLAFVVLGAMLLVFQGTLTRELIAVILAGSLLVAFFVLLQRGGLVPWLEHKLSRFLVSAGGVTQHEPGRFRAELEGLYANRRALARCFIIRLAGWLAGVVEVWLTLYLLGLDPSLVDAVVMESLGYAARAFAFLLPGALGVQELIMMGAASAVGLSAETGLVISLVKRVRELASGLPGLVLWSAWEMDQRPPTASARLD